MEVHLGMITEENSQSPLPYYSKTAYSRTYQGKSGIYTRKSMIRSQASKRLLAKRERRHIPEPPQHRPTGDIPYDPQVACVTLQAP